MKITLATKITIARIFLIIPTIAMFIAAELARVSQGAHIALIVIAAALFAICCATDFVDGHIARKTNTVSMLGKFLDPLADQGCHCRYVVPHRVVPRRTFDERRISAPTLLSLRFFRGSSFQESL